MSRVSAKNLFALKWLFLTKIGEKLFFTMVKKKARYAPELIYPYNFIWPFLFWRYNFKRDCIERPFWICLSYVGDFFKCAITSPACFGQNRMAATMMINVIFQVTRIQIQSGRMVKEMLLMFLSSGCYQKKKTRKPEKIVKTYLSVSLSFWKS